MARARHEIGRSLATLVDVLDGNAATVASAGGALVTVRRSYLPPVLLIADCEPDVAGVQIATVRRQSRTGP
jgi:hypothetical protein